MASNGPFPDLSSDKTHDAGLQIRDDSATEIPFTFPPDAHVFLRDPLVKALVKETTYEVHKGVCFWTRAPLDKERFALDHVLPKSRNGPDSLFNLVPTSIHINNIRGNAFETEAVIACLSIIRMVYGPRALRLLRNKLRDAGEPSGNWWCVDDSRIRRPRLIPHAGRDSLIEALEQSRTEIADLVRTRDLWVFAIEFWLSAKRMPRACLADIRRAWCAVATAVRAE